MFLYQRSRGFDDSELHRRLKMIAYVFIRFELGRAPTQQVINYMWRRRFSLADYQAIEATAREIRAVAADHGIASDGEPRLDPDEVSDEAVTGGHIMQAIRTACDRGLDAFETDPASNVRYPDNLFFDDRSRTDPCSGTLVSKRSRTPIWRQSRSRDDARRMARRRPRDHRRCQYRGQRVRYAVRADRSSPIRSCHRSVRSSPTLAHSNVFLPPSQQCWPVNQTLKMLRARPPGRERRSRLLFRRSC
jgi:hypothetical protein